MGLPKRKQLNLTLSERVNYGYNNINIAGLTNIDMLEDAFNKLTVVLDKLAPVNPPYLSDSNVLFTLTGNSATYPSPNSFKSGYISGTNTSVNNITGLTQPIFASPSNALYYFFSGDSGSLKLNNVATYLNLNSNDNTGATLVADGYTLTILDDEDYYIGQTGKENFWKALRVQIQRSTALLASNSEYSFDLSHYRAANGTGGLSGSKTSPLYRIESINNPNITSFTLGSVNYNSGKKISGVPTLDTSDSYSFLFNMTNVAKYYYLLNPISYSSTNNDLITTSWSWPAIPAANSSQNNMILNASPVANRYRNRDGNISGSGGPLSSTIIASDVLGLTDTESLQSIDYNKLRIDTISVESTRRILNSAAIYTNQLYDYDNTQELVGNVVNSRYNSQLQLKGGQYVYPTENYSGYLPAGPDYSGQTNMRYITFKIGTVTNVKQVQILIPGLTQEIADSNFSIYIKVGNYDNTFGFQNPVTGWSSIGTEYTGTSIQQNAINNKTNGAAALDLINNPSHSATNRLATLVTSGDTGTQKDVYIRVAWNNTNSNYKITAVPTILGTNNFGTYTNYSG